MKKKYYSLTNQNSILRFINNIKFDVFIAAFLLLISISACEEDSSDDPEPVDDNKADYTIWLQLGSWPNTTQYVVGAEDLSSGSVSLEGNGAEVTAMADYGIIPKDGYYYYPSTSSDFGKMSKFEFIDNQLVVVDEVPFTYQNSISSYTWIDDNTLLMLGTNGDGDEMLYSLVDAESLAITNGTIALPSLPEGYTAYQEGSLEYADGKIYLAYSNNADWPALALEGISIAVIDYPSMTVNTIIESDEASGGGGSSMWMPTSGVDESGDVYMMFFADWRTTEDSPSILVKINGGDTALDEAYSFDLKEALGGDNAVGFWYVSNGNAIVKYEDSQITNDNPEALHIYKFALLNIYTQTASKLTDIPADKGSNIGNVAIDGNIAYISSNDETGADYIWSVDTETSAVSPGLEVEGGYDYILRLDNMK